MGIGISIGMAFIVLTAFTGNIIVSFWSTFMIGAIVCGVVAGAVFQGWKLGILQSVNFVMVPGLSVDFVGGSGLDVSGLLVLALMRARPTQSSN